nr:MAG TPA: hypothetical protein [Crassvirales sp.]
MTKCINRKFIDYRANFFFSDFFLKNFWYL